MAFQEEGERAAGYNGSGHSYAGFPSRSASTFIILLIVKDKATQTGLMRKQEFSDHLTGQKQSGALPTVSSFERGR